MLLFYLSLLDGEEDKQKFTVIYEKYRQLLYNTAYHYVHDSYLAEDCVHDAFVDIARNFSKVGEPDEARTVAYLLTIVRTCSVHVFHAQNKTVTLADEDFDTYAAPEASFVQQGELQDAVQSLPPLYRDVLLLRYFYDYTTEQVASLCKSNEATIRKRLERAKEMLRKSFDVNIS